MSIARCNYKRFCDWYISWVLMKPGNIINKSVTLKCSLYIHFLSWEGRIRWTRIVYLTWQGSWGEMHANSTNCRLDDHTCLVRQALGVGGEPLNVARLRLWSLNWVGGGVSMGWGYSIFREGALKVAEFSVSVVLRLLRRGVFCVKIIQPLHLFYWLG